MDDVDVSSKGEEEKGIYTQGNLENFKIGLLDKMQDCEDVMKVRLGL